jgi:hypothetical protein
MTGMESASLRAILNQVESLSLEQQEELFHILRRQLQVAQERAERRDWMSAQAQAFASAWDDDADAVYDSL